MNHLVFLILIFSSFVFCENKTYHVSYKWPCPLAEEIKPCTCNSWFYGQGEIGIFCEDVTDINEIERVFSVEFPFNDLHGIELTIKNKDVWEQSEPVVLPANIFKDKTTKRITIAMKVKEIDPDTFNNTAHTIERLNIDGLWDWNGAGLIYANPIQNFSLNMLQSFPNFESLRLAGTMLDDAVFEDANPPFSEMDFPNMGNYTIT